MQSLEAELPQDSSDLSVDDLKVFTEEELMDMALKQVFQGTKENNPPLFNQPNNNNNAPEYACHFSSIHSQLLFCSK
jgi:hypothetical protein